MTAESHVGRMKTEAERLAEERLDLMPRSVRDKLDRVGVKVHLKDWQALALADRERLRDLPCESPDEVAGYRVMLDALIVQVTGRPPDRLSTSDPSGRNTP